MVLLFFIAFGTWGKAQEAGLDYVGSALWSKAYDIRVQGNLAYASFLNGLLILDFSDRKKPVALSQLYLAGGFGLALDQNLVFVAAGDKGLQVVDVSESKAPRLRGSARTAGEARDVEVLGHFAFVAAGSAGLEVFDVSDPSAPRPASTWDSPGEALGLLVRGDLVYLADGQAGVHILSVRDPFSPKLVGSWDTEGTAEEVAISGNRAFVADGSSGLAVIDVARPSSPRGIASLATSGYAHSVSGDGPCLLVGNLYDGGYQVVDISSAASPKVLATGRYTMYNEAWKVVLVGETALVVDYFSGINIIDVSNKNKPVALGLFATPSSVTAAGVWDGHAFAAGEIAGLLALDISDPASPRPVGSFGFYRGVQGLKVAGIHAFLTNRRSLNIFNISRPEKPVLVREFAIPEGVPRAVAFKDNLVYLTADHFGLYVIDISNPAQPSLKGSYKIPGFSYGLAVAGSHVYLANSDSGFHILDLGEPASPRLAGTLKLEGEPWSVAVEGNYAFVACGAGGLQVVDISRSSAPRVVGSCAVEDFANGLVLMDHYAFVSDAGSGVKKIEIRNPSSPRLTASYDTPGDAQALAVYGSYVLVSDSYSLLILK